jgi:hypothetical protein
MTEEPQNGEPLARQAQTAPAEQILMLLHDAREETLLALLDHPAFDETHLCLLLERKELSEGILEEIARRKSLLKSYRVKRALVAHPHVPRLIGMRLLRELYLLDLVQISLQPSVHTELRRQAEELLTSRLPQAALGQKIMLARRGPARVAGALLAEGHPQVLPAVLDNPFLTEAQVLKVLARERLAGGIIPAIARHRKWSRLEHVRMALVRHPATPLSAVLAFLPMIPASDLKELAAIGSLPESLRGYLRREVERRLARGVLKDKQA